MSATPKPAQDPEARRPGKRTYPREVAGVILIGIVVLILTLIRYWQNISWSAR